MKNIKGKLSGNRVEMVKRLPIDQDMRYPKDNPSGNCICLMCQLYRQFSLQKRFERIRNNISQVILTHWI